MEMMMNLMAGKADQTVYEAEGGAHGRCPKINKKTEARHDLRALFSASSRAFESSGTPLGVGGAYHAWSPSKSPLLSEFNLGAALVLLHPLAFVLPHFFDSSKFAYILQGTCTIGLVTPNSLEEIVVVIKKGDVLPFPRGGGVASWWFNNGDTNITALFLGETTKSQVPGELGFFFLAGVQGILHGLQSDLVAKIYNLDINEAEKIVGNQRGDC
ncbi:hypothetical protein LXL04_001360 [Taraxacum kok-saghyz]